ncbi:nuclear transport factor 2 family protein [Sphingomonas elodea]|uniref:nuclear transport factor 2 family protein n=1 Tax=Sphingomonas elodea TaxID=179878 RepID=UPI00026313CD|nr:nuclear transport factor 2 family protein [Sphingomonas elodea]
MFIHALAIALLSAGPVPQTDDVAVAQIEATCLDYIDGQLEGDPKRVARSLHPDLAKRAIIGDTPDERLGLRRMTKEELVDLTRQGVLRTPREAWQRACRILDRTSDTASVRLETKWFVDYFHMGRFGDRWVIVNALWYPIPRAASTSKPPASPQ